MGECSLVTRKFFSNLSIIILGSLLAGCVLYRPTPVLTPPLHEVPFAAELQVAIEETLQANDSGQPLGISMAVSVPGYRVWTGTAGESHADTPISQDMLFDAGSIAKNYEAALALKLVEEGRLNLDDPISRWLPEYPNVDPKINVRQLLNHTSGIYNVFDHPDFPWVGSEIDYTRRWEIEEVFENFVLAPYHPPGEGQRYSSTNYLLLTAVLEKVSGNSVTDGIEKEFLQPLALNNSFITMGALPPSELPAAHPWSDIDNDGILDDLDGIPTTWKASLTHPVLYTTPEDLVTWLAALYTDRTVLSPDSIDAMLTFPDIDNRDPGGAYYGLGVIDFSQLLGMAVYGHGGSSLGYNAAAAYLPDYDVVLAWAINTGESPADLAARMMDQTWESLSQVMLKNLE